MYAALSQQRIQNMYTFAGFTTSTVAGKVVAIRGVTIFTRHVTW